jgi:hypothetical protein
MDHIAKGQRGGYFSMPMSLTIGDSSTHYHKQRRDEKEIGRVRAVSVNRGKNASTQPFEKLKSLAVGDEYQDAGKYFLRTEAGKKKIGGSFAPAGSGKTVRTSEFEHMKEYEFSTPGPKKIPKQVSSRRTPECFSKKLMYIEDAYERKEDMRKLDY